MKISQPYLFISGPDGTGFTGSMYIGYPDKNAEIFPKPIFFDEDLTLPAAQPVSIIDGFPVRRGTPADIFIDGLYSITLRDKSGKFIYSKPSEGNNNLALNSVFNYLTPSEISDVTSNTASINLTTKIQAAITDNYSVYFPSGTYLTSTLTLKTGSHLFGCGPTTILKKNLINASYGILYTDSGSSSDYISNITIRDLQIRGLSDTEGFSEFKHLISLHGVKNVLIQNVQLVGFQGDGIYLGSSVTAGVERHNYNVTIDSCLFDGVNNENRNGVSIIDGDGITISKSRFINCTKSTMPGCIDIEPNANTFSVCRNIKILGNHFSNCLGNVGTVAFVFANVIYTTQPQSFVISNNVFDVDIRAMTFLNYTTYAEPFNCVVSGNTGKCDEGFEILKVWNGITFTGNCLLTSKQAGFQGTAATDTIRNTTFTGNIFTSTQTTTSGGIIVLSAINSIFMGNIFIGYYNYAMRFGYSGATIKNVDIIGNKATALRGTTPYFATYLGGVDGTTCTYYNNGGSYNSDDTPSTEFPAWRTDNTGVMINGATSPTVFNTATLPDTFPAGTCMALLVNDTGAPSTGGYQGVLYNHKPTTKSGLEKFSYQTYYHSNNTVKVGSFFIRRRNTSANTWTAWYEVVGV